MAPLKSNPSSDNSPSWQSCTEDFVPASRELACWKLVQKSLLAEDSALLLTVVDASSGSPGRQGFKMVITKSGEMTGTIGGGAMEYRFIQEAQEMLSKKESGTALIRQEHTKEALEDERSGMICSGFQMVASCPLYSDSQKTVNSICSALEEETGGFFELTSGGLSAEIDSSPSAPIIYTESSDTQQWFYRESLSPHHTVHIIGGGHVGLALSRVMHTLDFQVKVYDHRSGLELLDKNRWAHKKTITPYSALTGLIPEGDNQFVAVVSTTFKTDEAALRALSGKKFGYIGVMGSDAKISKIKESLARENISDDSFRNLHAPIGIPIKSHTAEEIAVSIAAEIIQVKNQKKAN